eukprot:139664-Rhodomonas_salina.1
MSDTDIAYTIRVCYAMRGTITAYDIRVCYAMRGTNRPYAIRVCYAMSGTEVAYGAPRRAELGSKPMCCCMLAVRIIRVGPRPI